MASLLIVAFDASEVEAGAAFGQKLGLPFDIVCLAGDPATGFGAGHAYAAGLADIPPADGLARGLNELAESYSHITAVSSMASKDVMARLAGLLDAAMVTDAMAIESPTVFKRPVVAGAAIATVEVLSSPVVITFRPAGFGKPEPVAGACAVEKIDLPTASNVKVSERTARGGARPDLTQAKIIISGGRPLRDAETFEKVIGGFADSVGGAVGATRAAVDSGIAPNELQVGQTGKIVAPDLYIAAGISGSTQHMAGIKDSKTIVAINKDPDAPIFEFADLGLVADLFDAVPELQQKLKS